MAEAASTADEAPAEPASTEYKFVADAASAADEIVAEAESTEDKFVAGAASTAFHVNISCEFVTDAIQEWILRVAKTPVSQFSELSTNGGSADAPPEVCIVELGGTLGDIESMPFVEALRQLQDRLGYKNMCLAHVSLVPALGEPPEQKTKPTQHSVKQMMSMGLRPDFLCCRGSAELEPSTVAKLSLFTNCRAIVSLHDVSNIYRVPLMMIEQKLHR